MPESVPKVRKTGKYDNSHIVAKHFVYTARKINKKGWWQNNLSPFQTKKECFNVAN